jgi:hypothetical protein
MMLLALVIPASAANLRGTASDDNLVGTDRKDKTNGLAGSDQIDALAQNDSVGGGEGADIINGGTGVDTLNAHAGSDHVRAAPNTDDQVMDFIDCGPGMDFLYVESDYTGSVLNCEHRQHVSDWDTSRPSWPVKDPDGDGWASDGAFADNCPDVANASQVDSDGDGIGEACDGVEPPPPSSDRDGDGMVDAEDNCADKANADQKDTDGDGTGDACDSDIDGDSKPNALDMCPEDPLDSCIVTPPPSPDPPPDGRFLAHGAYITGAPWTPSNIDSFTSLTGQTPKVIHWFESWSDTGFYKANYDAVYARGAVPMMTWQPWNHRNSPSNQSEYQLRDIVAGNYDSYIRTFAGEARSYGKIIYIRPMQEMNSDWFPWGVCTNGNTASEYVPAYRRIVDIFRQEGATNVKFVWTPNVQTNCSNYAALYPGDSYVDWVGLDGYNWGSSQSWSTWQSPTQLYKASYDELMSVAPNKPAMIAEYGCAEQGGSKAAWVRNLYLDAVPQSMPSIKLIMVYHEVWSGVDWRVNSSSTSLAAYQEVTGNARYQGSLP